MFVFSRKFSFSQRYLRKTCVRVVNDMQTLCQCSQRLYVDTCQRSQQLHGHCVSVVNSYVPWHTGNYFTSEKVKTKEKRNKKCNLIFSRNRFGLFIWGPDKMFWAKKWSKVSWHCPFNIEKYLKLDSSGRSSNYCMYLLQSTFWQCKK